MSKKMNEVGGLMMKGKHEKIVKVLKAWTEPEREENKEREKTEKKKIVVDTKNDVCLFHCLDSSQI